MAGIPANRRIETDIAQATSWSTVAKNIGATTQAMYTAVGTMQQVVNKAQVLISTAMSSPNNTDLLGQAQSIMTTLLTQTNQQVGGVYLFSGGNTSVAPVDLTHYPTLNATTNAYDPSTADTGYYTGDNHVQAVQVNLQQTVSYGVTGNNPAIEEAIRSVELVIQAAQVSSSSTLTATDPNAASTVAGGTLTVNGQNFAIASGVSLNQVAQSINSQANGSGVTASVQIDTAGNYHLVLANGQNAMTVNDTSGLGLASANPQSQAALTNSLQAALTTTNKAVADLGNLQETVSNTSNTLSNAQQTQTSFVTYLQNSLSGVKDVDTAQAAAQVQQFQTQLQASFLAVSTLTKLSLASFL